MAPSMLSGGVAPRWRPNPTSPSPVSRAARSVPTEWRTADGHRVASAGGVVDQPAPRVDAPSRAPTARATAVQGSGSGRSVPRCTSRSTVSRSTPEMPSTMQWWTLEIERPATVGEALDDPCLPQRTVPVERLRHEPRHEPAQLGVAARRGQRGVTHVVRQVEVRVVDPHRPAQLQRDESHASGGSAGCGGASPRADARCRRTPERGPRRPTRRRCAGARPRPRGEGTPRRAR